MNYDYTLALIIYNGYRGDDIYKVFSYLTDFSFEESQFFVDLLLKRAKEKVKANEKKV